MLKKRGGVFFGGHLSNRLEAGLFERCDDLYLLLGQGG